jgi:hypothetical protein
VTNFCFERININKSCQMSSFSNFLTFNRKALILLTQAPYQKLYVKGITLLCLKGCMLTMPVPNHIYLNNIYTMLSFSFLCTLLSRTLPAKGFSIQIPIPSDSFHQTLPDFPSGKFHPATIASSIYTHSNQGLPMT